MLKNILIIALMIISTFHIPSLYSAENASPSYAQSTLDYLVQLYNWIVSLMDQRTPEQIADDNARNETLFNDELEKADALITSAEELHMQVKKPLDLLAREKINRYIKSLENNRINLSLLQARLSPSYVKEAGTGMLENFKQIKNFNPLSVYQYLAQQFATQEIFKNQPAPNTKGLSFTQVEKAKEQLVKQNAEAIRTSFSAETIYNNIQQLLADLTKLRQGGSAEAKKLRQIAYLFQNQKAKEQFDAFLKGDKEGGLFSLKIADDGTKMERIQELINRLTMVKAELQNDLR